MLTNKNVWKTVGLFILISIPAELLALVISHYFGPRSLISISMACFFAAGNFLGAIFLQKFQSLKANELVYAGIIYMIINILLGIPNHSKFIQLFVSFFESAVLVLGTYSLMRPRFNQKTFNSISK